MYSIKPTMSILMLAFLILQVARFTSAYEILTKPQSYEVPEGGKVILDCQVKDNPKEEKTLWTKINKKGEKDTIYVGSFKVSKDPHFGKRFENNSIEIVNANKDDEGAYECLLTIDNGSGVFTKITHELVIQYKPEMDTNPQRIEVLENSQVSLNCAAEGVPKPTYTWERKGKLPSNFNKESAKNTFNADPDVSGQYFCTATNILGSVSKAITVDVKFQPEVVISEQVNSEQPTVRNIICTVRANPKPDYVNLYKVGTGSYARESDTIEDETNPFLSKYTRVFSVKDEKDFGEYFCVSKNAYGENRKSHNVTLDRPKPEQVRLIDFPPNNVLTDKSELQWYIKSPFDIINFQLTVSKVTQATPGTTLVVLFAHDVKPKKTEEREEYQGSYRLDSDELETGNTYQFGIKAINAYGMSSDYTVDVYLQKSSSSSANQSVIFIFLILAISLFHFSNTRLH